MEEGGFKVNNRQIARNTLFLYFRMLVLLLVSLYTSRIILQSLGIEDYGIYDVVGGVLAFFAIVRESLRDTIMRYMTYEIGSSGASFQIVFSTSFFIQLLLSLIIIVLAETIGLWFLYNVLVFPEGRYDAAFWCYQFSILTFVIKTLSIPYDAVIIANERMSAFAYISIIDSFGQLLIAWCIVLSPIDRLVSYACLIAIHAIIIRMIYANYCRRNFSDCKLIAAWDKKMFGQMTSFAGWSLIGSAAFQMMTQGVSLLLNVYFGVVVNAARAVASQVGSGVSIFVSNFSQALGPQIIKSYAADKKNDMFALMFRGARVSYYMLLIMAVPVMCETEKILDIWLVAVPIHAVAFVRLMIITSLISVLAYTQDRAAQATGHMKKYQIILGSIGLFVFPLSWLFLWLGYPPEITYVVVILAYLVQFGVRLYLIREMVGLPVMEYCHNVVKRIACVSLLAFSVPLVVCYTCDSTWLRLVIVIVISFLVTSSAAFLCGFSNDERRVLIVKARKMYHRYV